MRDAGSLLTRGHARILRGLTMSLACLVFPTAAHGLAGGDVMINPGATLALVLLSVACVALADRRRSWREIGVILLIAQPTFHVLLAAGGHHSHAAIAPSPSMVMAHVCAMIALTSILSSAETVAWTLAALRTTALLTRLHLLFGAAPAVSPVVPRRSPLVDEVRSWTTRLLVSSAPRRGPPLACLPS